MELQNDLKYYISSASNVTITLSHSSKEISWKELELTENLLTILSPYGSPQKLRTVITYLYNSRDGAEEVEFCVYIFTYAIEMLAE